jgi:uncharacterized protein YggE
MAIKDAKAKAKTLAGDLDVRLGEMVNYYEDENMPTPYYGYGMGGDMMMKSESASIEPMMPTGENTVTSRVTLMFTIN